MQQIRDNQNGIPTCVIKWKYPRLLIGVMRLGLFVIYVTKTIRLRLLLVVNFVKFAIQQNTACEISMARKNHSYSWFNTTGLRT